MWLEVEARYIPPYGRGETDSPLEIESAKQLDATQTRVLFEDKALITRRTKQKATATVLDDDRAKIDFEGFGDSNVQAGIAGEFTYIVEQPMVVEKQDIVVQGRNDTLHGLLWLDEEGIRQHPIYVEPGRNFYEDDTDPEALKLFQRLADERERPEKGGMSY